MKQVVEFWWNQWALECISHWEVKDPNLDECEFRPAAPQDTTLYFDLHHLRPQSKLQFQILMEHP